MNKLKTYSRLKLMALFLFMMPTLFPSESSGYTILGEGRITRVDAIVVWKDGRQVLALLPYLQSTGEGSFLLLPVPPGAEVVVSPDADMFSAPEDLGDNEQDEEAEDIAEDKNDAIEGGGAPLAKPDGGKVHKSPPMEHGRPPINPRALPRDASRPNPRRDQVIEEKLRERGARQQIQRHGSSSDSLAAPKGQDPRIRTRRAPVDRGRILSNLRRFQPPLVYPKEPPSLIFSDSLIDSINGATGHRVEQQLDEQALKSYIDHGWGFALVALPESSSRIRFGPVAISMDCEQPVIPLRLAAGSGPHLLSIRFVSPDEIVDLGSSPENFGLRHSQRPTPLEASLGAWLSALGFTPDSSWRNRGLVSGALDTRRFSLDDLSEDLIIPVPYKEPEKELQGREKDDKTSAQRRFSCGCGATQGSALNALWVFLLVCVMLGLAGLKRKGLFLSLFLIVLARPLPSFSQSQSQSQSQSEVLVESSSSPIGMNQRRVIEYPRATVEGVEPPLIRLVDSGVPVALYFPNDTLDPRSEVHFVGGSPRISLRITERTAYLKTLSDISVGSGAALTITLSDGRPLVFGLKIVDQGESFDVAIEVLTDSKKRISMMTELAHLRDELAECRETDAERTVVSIAKSIADAPVDHRPVSYKPMRLRDKQNRLFVEVIETFRIHKHTFIRLSVDNRDGSKNVWTVGEPTITVVGPGERRVPLHVMWASSHSNLELGESAVMVLAVETPRLSLGASLRVVLHEAHGRRHIVLDSVEL